MLKTLFVDGDKGGIGKTLVCHLLVDMYNHSQQLKLPASEYPLILFDADPVNKDFSSYPARFPDGKLIPCFPVNLSIIEGWYFMEKKLKRFLKNNQAARAIVNCPNHFHSQIEQCRKEDVGALLTRLHMLPLWLLNRGPLSVLNLQARHRLLPDNYQQGLAILNLIFGPQDTFQHWHYSQFRHDQVTNGLWLETSLPVLNHDLSATFCGIPMSSWLEYGVHSHELTTGFRVSLNAFRHAAHQALLTLESIELHEQA